MIEEILPWEEIFAKAKYGHRPDIKSGIEASLLEGREFAEQGIASDNADVLDNSDSRIHELLTRLSSNLYVGVFEISTMFFLPQLFKNL